MSNNEKAQFKRLRAAYDEAFQVWARQVEVLRSLSANSLQDGRALQDAGSRVEQARKAYHQSRNLLADFMLTRLSRTGGPSARSVSAPGSAPEGSLQDGPDGENRQPERSQVRNLAYVLWERAGRPSGSAEDDWRHAEQLAGEMTR